MTTCEPFDSTPATTCAKEHLEQLNLQIKELVGLYREALVHSGHSENEFWIWYALIVMDGAYTQQDICGMWALSKQTVNNIITRMVQADYVRLESVPGTRNHKFIRLTETGRAFGESLILPVYGSELRAFARLTPESRHACMMVLSQYTRYLKEELSAVDYSDIPKTEETEDS